MSVAVLFMVNRTDDCIANQSLGRNLSHDVTSVIVCLVMAPEEPRSLKGGGGSSNLISQVPVLPSNKYYRDHVKRCALMGS